MELFFTFLASDAFFIFFSACTVKYKITELFSNSFGDVFLFDQVTESATAWFSLTVVDILRFELRNAPGIYSIRFVFALLVLSQIGVPWWI